MDTKQQFEETTAGLIVRAPAKINLSLLIAGRRNDGFHELETIMAKVDLMDQLLIEQSQTEGLQLICTGKYPVSGDPENLVYKAYKKLAACTDKPLNIKITLTKNIPVASGLGGGSSDAAAAIMGINRFCKLNLSNPNMHEIAASLGSDINFFLAGPVALCTGRGEKIKNFSNFLKFSAILLLPDVSVSTKSVYENYKHKNNTFLLHKEEINKFLSKNAVDSLSQICTNMLEESCFELYTQLEVLKSRVESLELGRVCLSGSGSTLYILVDGTEDKLKRYQMILHDSVTCDSIIVNSNRW